ncbi:MAG: DUF362 domain-containing protein [Candidatus Bathyarchaeota archaeon]|nr:MAG: DUF362 domain-containing protein [Candidatus Bathyarchaeota archaeon]
MPVPHHRFGQTTIAKVSDSHELRQVLVDPWLESEKIIIKPNWVCTEPASFTDSESLRTLLEALDSRIVVTESLHIGRSMNLLEEGMSFTVGEKEVNWEWLFRGEGWNWLMENRDWGWFKEGGHYDQIKKEDEAFLDIYGFTDLFEEFDVEYINVTDEVWSGRIADPNEVKRSVETRFKPVQIDKLYSMMPKKLYDLRGSTFISFAKLKYYPTFTIKNLFGMIPDPLRPWWHGHRQRRRAASIVDINKVYHSLFNVYGICEALNTLAVLHPEGEIQSKFLKRPRYNIVEGLGFVAFGRDLVALDAILFNLAGFDFKRFWGYINLAEEEFGTFDREALKESEMVVGDWLTP